MIANKIMKKLINISTCKINLTDMDVFTFDIKSRHYITLLYVSS